MTQATSGVSPSFSVLQSLLSPALHRLYQAISLLISLSALSAKFHPVDLIESLLPLAKVQFLASPLTIKP